MLASTQNIEHVKKIFTNSPAWDFFHVCFSYQIFWHVISLHYGFFL